MSKSLSETEKLCLNIKWELVGIVFSVLYFKHYVYDHSITVISDHKPLSTLFQKSLQSTAHRLTQMLLKISDYNINVVYWPGNTMQLSDTLRQLNSHNVADGNKTEIRNMDVTIHDIEITDFVSSTAFSKIQHGSSTDEESQLLMKTINTGWPHSAFQCHELIRKYFNFREELSVIDRLVLKCNRITIPVSLRQDTMDKLHQSHLGISKSLLWARSSFYWPGLTKDVTNLIEKCSSCQSFQNHQQRESLLNVLPSSKPWTSLASDILKFDGKSYLIVVDHMSKFILVRLIADHSAETTIKEFIWIVNEHGIPQELHIARGSNFTSKTFMDFCKSLDIILTYSSAYHHSSNPAKLALQTVRNWMKNVSVPTNHGALLCLHIYAHQFQIWYPLLVHYVDMLWKEYYQVSQEIIIICNFLILYRRDVTRKNLISMSTLKSYLLH